MNLGHPNWRLRTSSRFGTLAVLVLAAARPAEALPVFAHRYSLSCQVCHTTVPRLNSFGESFKDNGFRLPGGRKVFPFAVKANLTWSTGADSTGLPKAVVDEIELLSAGSIGNKSSYFIEDYVIDGGRPGLPRDVWLSFDLSKDRAATRLRVRAGQWSLPLPVDVESERSTLAHYALYDQTVGGSTFRFFDPRLGVDTSLEFQGSGVEAHLDAVAAADRQSGMPGIGTDFFTTLSKRQGAAVLETYRYMGKRALQGGLDTFWRQGFSLAYKAQNLSLTGVVQTGNDTLANYSLSSSAHSGGGFLEGAYDSSPALRFVGRYERISDVFTGAYSQLVFAAITRPKSNMRFTIEDVVLGGRHNLSSGLLFAY